MTTLTRARLTPWGLMTALSLLVGAYGVAMVASGFAMLPDDIAANGFPMALRVHIAASSVALLVVPWQLAAGLRARRPRLHHVTGRLYVVAALVGGTTGAAAGFTTTYGPVASAGFVSLGVCWVIATAMALVMAMRRDLTAHRRWAIRSFALVFAGVTLRLYLGVSGAAGVPFEVAYPVIAWLSWLPNLWVAERIVRSNRLRVGARL